MAPLEEQEVKEEVHGEEGEDVEPLRLARNPKLPSAEDVEAHNWSTSRSETGANGATSAADAAFHTATRAARQYPSWG